MPLVTSPSVSYEVECTDETRKVVTNALELPEPQKIKEIFEPFASLHCITPEKYMGKIIEVINKKRGTILGIDPSVEFGENSFSAKFEMPLIEIISGLQDTIKSLSSGYASMEYEFLGLRKSKIVKMDILINKEIFDSLSILVHEKKVIEVGKKIVAKLKNDLPRQNFTVPIQAAIGGKIIARETLQSFRKDVTAKLYGGDQTRKDKLLKKQAKGKKRMQSSGRVQIKKETYLKLISD